MLGKDADGIANDVDPDISYYSFLEEQSSPSALFAQACLSKNLYITVFIE